MQNTSFPWLPLAACAAVIICPGPAQAANHHVRAGASGDGTDWANALPALPATLVRGDTYYVAAGSYGSYTFATPGSATVTIRRATAADHGASAGWQAAYASGTASWTGLAIDASNVVIDGQTGGGPGSWKTGHGFEVVKTGPGSGGDALILLGAGAGNVTIRHLRAQATLGTKTAGIKGTLGGNHHIVVSRCYITDIFGVHFHMNGWTDSVIEYSYLANNKSTADWHSEGISYIGTVADLTIRYNIWHDIEGTAIFAGVNDGLAKRWRVHGNVLSGSACPPVAVYNDGSNNNKMEELEFHNNTITRISASQGGLFIQSGSGNKAYNNLWFTNRCNSLSISADHDYNWFGDNLRLEGCNPPCDLDPAAVSAEPHGEDGATNPFVAWDGVADPATADFRLKSATTPGVALAPALGKDMYGNTRGADGVWDRGAVEHGPVAPDLGASKDGAAVADSGAAVADSGATDAASRDAGGPDLFGDAPSTGDSAVGTAGDDGCSCAATGPPNAPGPWTAVLLALALVGLRRRRPG
jgi:MYXO-CTERM domain-containing protein